MHMKLERLLSKSLTTLEVMTHYLVVHTGPGVSVQLDVGQDCEMWLKVGGPVAHGHWSVSVNVVEGLRELGLCSQSSSSSSSAFPAIYLGVHHFG